MCTWTETETQYMQTGVWTTVPKFNLQNRTDNNVCSCWIWNLLSFCFPGESRRVTQGVPEQWICKLLHPVVSGALCSLLWGLRWWEHPVHGSPSAAEGQASHGFIARRREGKARPTIPHCYLSGQRLLRGSLFSDCWCNVLPFISLYVSSLQIVKFCQPGQDRVSPVGDVDIGIYQLQRSEKLLGERVEKLGLEADKYINSNMNLKKKK